MASSSSSFEKTLAVQLRLVGNGLLNAPSSVDQLLILLDDAEDILVNMEQEPSDFLLDALLPVMKGLIGEALFKHCNEDVRVAVASCLTEILRITSPEQPFNDDQMKAIFQLIVEALSKLSQPLTRCYAKALSILETIARVKACLLMLDLECEALVLPMCHHFWEFIRANPSADEYWAVEQIMADILAESEHISSDLLIPLLASVLKENEKVAPSCWKLGEKLISDFAAKLRPILRGALQSKGTTLDDYSPVVALLYQNDLQESGVLADELVGRRIKIWWPLDEMFYDGLIQSYNPLMKKHKVLYDDGDKETLNLEKERWEFIEDDLPNERQDADNPKPITSPIILRNGNDKSSHSTRISNYNENVNRARAAIRLPEVEASNFGNRNIGGDESSDDESTEDNVFEFRARSKDVPLENPSMSTSDDSPPEASLIGHDCHIRLRNGNGKSSPSTRIPNYNENVKRAGAAIRLPEVEASNFGNRNIGGDESSDDESTEDNLFELRARSKDVPLENPGMSTSDDDEITEAKVFEIRARSKDAQLENPSTSTSDDSTLEASPPRAIRVRSKDVQLENPCTGTSDDSTPEASRPRTIRVQSKDVQLENSSTSTSYDLTPEASLPRAIRVRSQDVQLKKPSTSTSDDSTPEASPPRPWGLSRSWFRLH